MLSKVEVRLSFFFFLFRTDHRFRLHGSQIHDEEAWTVCEACVESVGLSSALLRSFINTPRRCQQYCWSQQRFEHVGHTSRPRIDDYSTVVIIISHNKQTCSRII